MIREWRKSTKDARYDAQDSGTRKLAQVTRETVSESESEDEVVTHDDSENEGYFDGVEGVCTVEELKARLS